MKEKMLVKVVASIVQEINGRDAISVARGISPLKRGDTVFEFATQLLTDREVPEYSLHQRSEDNWSTSPITVSDDPRIVMTYHFVQFPANEIGFNAKDLTALELERDMKQLKKIING